MPDSAPAAVHVHVPVRVRVVGVPTEAQRRSVARRATELVAARTAEAQRTLAERRRVRRITLRKAEKVVEYLLADGSVARERLRWHADPPAGTYQVIPNGGRLTWSCPPELRPFAAERGHLLETDRADRARNPGTFEGVDSVELAVVGERIEVGYPGLDDALRSAEVRRYLELRERYHRRFPARSVPELAAPVDVAGIDAVFRLRDRLAVFTVEHRELLTIRFGLLPPAGDWVAADHQLASLLDGPEWRAAVAAGVRRDAAVAAAAAAVDPAAEEQAVARLAGLEGAYDLILAYENRHRSGRVNEEDAEREERMAAAEQAMLRELRSFGFDSVLEFDIAVAKLRAVVRRRAVSIALTSMRESERVLRAELQRYAEPTTLATLAGELAPWRPPPQPSVQVVSYLGDQYPMLRSEVALRGALSTGVPDLLGDILRQNAEAQLQVIERIRDRLADQHDEEAVFRLDIVVEQALAAMGLDPGSVQARVIRAGRMRKLDAGELVLDLVNALLLILAFAAGPAGWLALVVRIAPVAVAAVAATRREIAAHEATDGSAIIAPLSTRPDPAGLREMVDLLVAVGFNVPFVRPGLVPRAPVPFRTAAVAEQLAELTPGLRARLADVGTVELTLPGTPGALRVTAEGWELHAASTAGKPVAAGSWHAEIPTTVFARQPELAGLTGAARTLQAVRGRLGSVSTVRPPLFGPDDLAGLTDEAGLAAANPNGTNLYSIRGDARTVEIPDARPGLDLRDLNRIEIRDGRAPLLPGDLVPPVRPGAPVPETFVVDARKAELAGDLENAEFRPNFLRLPGGGLRWRLRNAELGGPGAELITPGGPMFGPDRVLGGARGAVFDPVTGIWVPAGTPFPRPHVRLSAGGAFAPRPIAEWHAWEQANTPLTDTQRYALWFYSDDLSGQLNPALRGAQAQVFVEHPATVAAVARDIDSAMQATPFDAVLYRRGSLDDFLPLRVRDPAELAGLRGRTFQQPSPLSTSVEPRGHGSVDLVVDAPAGTRGRYLAGGQGASRTNPLRPAPGDPIASMPNEAEFLIERGTTFVIEDAWLDAGSGRWTVRVRVTEQGAP